MRDAGELQARAKRRMAALARARRDPRFKRVIGRFRAAGLLTTTMDIEPHREPIRVEEALWAGRTEPRVLELLPALIVKRPSLFQNAGDLPEDLDEVVASLRRNEEPPEFRGVPGRVVLRWLPSVGHRGKLPTRLKSFRFTQLDLKLLERLCATLGESQTEVVRHALRSLAAEHLRPPASSPGRSES